MTIKRAQKLMTKALRNNPEYKFRLAEEIAMFVMEDQRRSDTADKFNLKVECSARVFGRQIIDLIVRG